MFRVRRLGIFLFVPLLFQLSLAAKSVVCVNQGENGSGAASTKGLTQMPGMDMPAAPSQPGHSVPNKDSPCNGPFNPATCLPLAPCAFAAVTAVPTSAPSQPLRRHEVTPLTVLAPASWIVRPELPPPRA